MGASATGAARRRWRVYPVTSRARTTLPMPTRRGSVPRAGTSGSRRPSGSVGARRLVGHHAGQEQRACGPPRGSGAPPRWPGRRSRGQAAGRRTTPRARRVAGYRRRRAAGPRARARTPPTSRVPRRVDARSTGTTRRAGPGHRAAAPASRPPPVEGQPSMARAMASIGSPATGISGRPPCRPTSGPVTAGGVSGARIAVAVRDRHAPILAERLGRDTNTGRRLPALVLGPVDERCHPGDEVGANPALDHIGDRAVMEHERFEQRVEDLVGRQALIVTLIGAQLGRRRLGRAPTRE